MHITGAHIVYLINKPRSDSTCSGGKSTLQVLHMSVPTPYTFTGPLTINKPLLTALSIL